MPTYRYECGRCGRIHEAFQAMSDPPLTICPDCGGPLTQLISGGAGVILKGSGFHNTDYRSKRSGDQARREESATKSPEPPAAEKKDKKAKKGPAAKD